jgi:hypothetical protein
MGFMDSIFGGEESQTTSGFQNLPPEIRNAFTSFATQGTGLLGGGAGDAMFRPMGTTQDESSAFGMFRQGFAPTSAADVSRDVGLFMNPFDQYVIDDINRQSQGDYSLLKQAVTDAGQFGSNRQVLGASELERQRLNAIGSFKQNQYNNALNMAITWKPWLHWGFVDGRFRRWLVIEGDRNGIYTSTGKGRTREAGAYPTNVRPALRGALC